MNTDNYFFRVPATRGIQGGIEQYMLTVPMVVLRRILAMDNLKSGFSLLFMQLITHVHRHRTSHNPSIS